MSKYLYCASVQGIQDFIFKTNELQHIVGASELVEEICTKAFDDFRGQTGESGFVVRAAGNIKFVFDNESDCQKAVREFPRKVMTMAPGITISQAVCKLDDKSETAFGDAIDEAEQLLKIQRNMPAASCTSGWMGIKRANNTGLPISVVGKDKRNMFLDEATRAKIDYNKVFRLCEKSFGINNLLEENIAYYISKITGKNDWIAVIHADGNGLGKVVQKVGKKKDTFKEFSSKLNEATIEAAQMAFSSVKDLFGTNTTPTCSVKWR